MYDSIRKGHYRRNVYEDSWYVDHFSTRAPFDVPSRFVFLVRSDQPVQGGAILMFTLAASVEGCLFSQKLEPSVPQQKQQPSV